MFIRRERDVAARVFAHHDRYFQAAWYDGDTVMYAIRRGRAADVCTVPADGSGTPDLPIPDAESPAALWLAGEKGVTAGTPGLAA